MHASLTAAIKKNILLRTSTINSPKKVAVPIYPEAKLQQSVEKLLACPVRLHPRCISRNIRRSAYRTVAERWWALLGTSVPEFARRRRTKNRVLRSRAAGSPETAIPWKASNDVRYYKRGGSSLVARFNPRFFLVPLWCLLRKRAPNNRRFSTVTYR